MYLHAEFLVQQLRRYLPSQLQLFLVQVEGQVLQCELEVYLYGDMTIQVVRAQVQFLDSGHMPVVV